MGQPAEILELSDPVRRVYDYWQSLPNLKGLPLKSALEPMNMPLQILPHVFLVELEYEPFAALIRLQGTYINSALGQQA